MRSFRMLALILSAQDYIGTYGSFHDGPQCEVRASLLHSKVPVANFKPMRDVIISGCLPEIMHDVHVRIVVTRKAGIIGEEGVLIEDLRNTGPISWEKWSAVISISIF